MNESPHYSPTQAAAILAHLRLYDFITPLEALERYGCFRLAARIWELRQAGHHIEGERYRTIGGKSVIRYRLVAG